MHAQRRVSSRSHSQRTTAVVHVSNVLPPGASAGGDNGDRTDDGAVNDSAWLWIDIFTVNQHVSEHRTREWWSTTFSETIRKIGSVICVLEPWSAPLPLTRAW